MVDATRFGHVPVTAHRCNLIFTTCIPIAASGTYSASGDGTNKGYVPVWTPVEHTHTNAVDTFGAYAR